MNIFQELRCREEELTRAQLQQRLLEQNLAQKERELEMREIDLAARELHILIFASNMSHNQPPQPNKRKGKFSKIKLLKKDTISSPLDFRHTLTVRPTEDESSVKQLVAVAKDTPPGSPAIMRAIALPADGVKGKTWGPSTPEPEPDALYGAVFDERTRRKPAALQLLHHLRLHSRAHDLASDTKRLLTDE
ncbi:hypothetical protein O3G_MSEX013016 [Manduca sexta]|uniref:Uncharacterized protein n=1 Tax=Manduca sexta TaxID=7130 RepID=A0A921ZPX1_MANSE|nr:hypothetical protein O3G_MSEX013016 [Manduca sexta]